MVIHAFLVHTTNDTYKYFIPWSLSLCLDLFHSRQPFFPLFLAGTKVTWGKLSLVRRVCVCKEWLVLLYDYQYHVYIMRREKSLLWNEAVVYSAQGENASEKKTCLLPSYLALPEARFCPTPIRSPVIHYQHQSSHALSVTYTKELQSWLVLTLGEICVQSL